MQFFKGNAAPKPASVKKEVSKDNTVEAMELSAVPEAYKVEAERVAKEKGGESVVLTQMAARVLSPDKKTVGYVMNFTFTRKNAKGSDESVDAFVIVTEVKGKLESRFYFFPTGGTLALESNVTPRTRRHA
jgi:hypothetical protein